MQGAAKILESLEKWGFEAYIVGGAVRDILMKRRPHDFDIVTSAKPDEVMAVLRKEGYVHTDLVGRAFGVVIAVLPEGTYEIATFRTERYGADSHRPESITYAQSLEEDVQRRDFTVNGMAMDLRGQVYDYVEGRRDIKKQCLRTIGEPKQRFREDGLRLFRACRFVGKLGFLPHPTLQEGMMASLERVRGLSLERVRQELEGLLLTPAVAKGLDLLVQSGLAACECQRLAQGKVKRVPILPELVHLVDTPQQKEFHAYDAWYHTLAVVQHTRPDLTIRWAALFHDVAKGLPGIRAVRNGKLTDYGHDTKGAEIARAVLLRLQYKKEFVERVAWLVENHMKFHYFAQHGEADAWKWVRREARSGTFRSQQELVEACGQQAEVCVADVLGCGKPHAATAGTEAFGACLQAIAEKIPVHTKDLRYPKSLPSLVGSSCREVLQNLLQRVQNGQLDNEPEALLAAAKRYLIRHEKTENINAGKL